MSIDGIDGTLWHRADYLGKDKTLRRFEKFTLDHGGFQVEYHLKVVFYGSVSSVLATM